MPRFIQGKLNPGCQTNTIAVLNGGDMKKKLNCKHALVFSVIAAVLFITTSCTEERPASQTTPSVSVPVSSTRVVLVSREDAGKPWSGENWPFTVPSGSVELIGCCSVVFHHEGKVYAINGSARTDMERKGYLDISGSSMWRDQPSGYGKINMGPIINLGLNLGED